MIRLFFSSYITSPTKNPGALRSQMPTQKFIGVTEQVLPWLGSAILCLNLKPILYQACIIKEISVLCPHNTFFPLAWASCSWQEQNLLQKQMFPSCLSRTHRSWAEVFRWPILSRPMGNPCSLPELPSFPRETPAPPEQPWEKGLKWAEVSQSISRLLLYVCSQKQVWCPGMY